MDRDKFEKLLTKPEDEYHDFKYQWYSSHDKSELIKDIFSFVNTVHHEDCYLIIGVDDNQKIVGVENDPNRLNTQNITNYLHDLPIANSQVPKVIVETLKIEQHELDIVVIKDTSDVPVYLAEDKHPKGASRPIHAGQIFVRENDTNTPINGTASDYQVELLWKKRLGLDLSIQDKYKVKLRDIGNWKYFETKQVGFIYNLNPDYCIFLEDDDTNKNKVESYSLGQLRPKLYWKKIILSYKNRTIDEYAGIFMDGVRFLSLAPELGSISPLFTKPLTFQYFIADSLEFFVESLFLNMNNPGISPDYYQKSRLFERIVIFDSKDQKEKVLKELSKKKEFIQNLCKPTAEEMNLCRGRMSMDFSKDDYEMSHDNVEFMCQEGNVSTFINGYLKKL